MSRTLDIAEAYLADAIASDSRGITMPLALFERMVDRIKELERQERRTPISRRGLDGETPPGSGGEKREKP